MELEVKNKDMKNVRNSCNRQGCAVGITLPHDRRIQHVSSRVLQVSNDTKKILFKTSISLEKGKV
jgi:hypothetical protein